MGSYDSRLDSISILQSYMDATEHSQSHYGMKVECDDDCFKIALVFAHQMHICNEQIAIYYPKIAHAKTVVIQKDPQRMFGNIVSSLLQRDSYGFPLLYYLNTLKITSIKQVLAFFRRAILIASEKDLLMAFKNIFYQFQPDLSLFTIAAIVYKVCSLQQYDKDMLMQFQSLEPLVFTYVQKHQFKHIFYLLKDQITSFTAQFQKFNGRFSRHKTCELDLIFHHTSQFPIIQQSYLNDQFLITNFRKYCFHYSTDYYCCSINQSIIYLGLKNNEMQFLNPLIHKFTDLGSDQIQNLIVCFSEIISFPAYENYYNCFYNFIKGFGNNTNMISTQKEYVFIHFLLTYWLSEQLHNNQIIYDSIELFLNDDIKLTDSCELLKVNLILFILKSSTNLSLLDLASKQYLLFGTLIKNQYLRALFIWKFVVYRSSCEHMSFKCFFIQ